MRNFENKEQCESLALRIIAVAVADLNYKQTDCSERQKEKNRKSAIKFFKGTWFTFLCDFAGMSDTRILRKIKEYYNDCDI